MTMWLVLAVVAAACVSSTVAVAPCDQVIIAKLSTVKDCYSGGKVPNLTATGVLGTHLRISRGELPADTKCVTALQHDGQVDVTVFLKSGGNVSDTYKLVQKCGYISEIDKEGLKYRVYVIHNEAHVYSYYRCLDGTTGGTGTPMGDVAVACKYACNSTSIAVVRRAESCFASLNIRNIMSLTPCDC